MAPESVSSTIAPAPLPSFGLALLMLSRIFQPSSPFFLIQNQLAAKPVAFVSASYVVILPWNFAGSLSIIAARSAMVLGGVGTACLFQMKINGSLDTV